MRRTPIKKNPTVRLKRILREGVGTFYFKKADG
jgi:hypothetical protein